MVRIPASWARAGFAGLPGAQPQRTISARRILVPPDEQYRNRVTVDLGNDGMAPQITMLGAGSGSGIASPSAFTTFAFTPVPQSGTSVTVTINWTVTLSGTLGAGDVNNFRLVALVSGVGQFLAQSVNVAVAGSYPQTPFTLVIAAGSGISGVALQAAPNAGTAGSVYGGSITIPGFGQTFIGPSSGGDLWSLDQCYLSTSVGQVDPAQCTVFAGPLPIIQYAITGSLAGGSSQFGLGGVAVPFGWFIWAVWSGGTAGAQANLRVTGVKTVLTN